MSSFIVHCRVTNAPVDPSRVLYVHRTFVQIRLILSFASIMLLCAVIPVIYPDVPIIVIIDVCSLSWKYRTSVLIQTALLLHSHCVHWDICLCLCLCLSFNSSVCVCVCVYLCLCLLIHRFALILRSVQRAARTRPITSSLANYALCLCVCFWVCVCLCLCLCICLWCLLIGLCKYSVHSWDEAHYHFISQVCVLPSTQAISSHRSAHLQIV